MNFTDCVKKKEFFYLCKKGFSYLKNFPKHISSGTKLFCYQGGRRQCDPHANKACEGKEWLILKTFL